MSDDEDGVNDTDYDGLQWMGGEAFYTKKKEKRKFTKDDSIYGVFLDDAEDGNEKQSGKGRRTNKRKESVTFVSSGVAPSSSTAQTSSRIEIILPQEKEKKTAPPVLEIAPDTALPTSFRRKIQEGVARRQKELQNEEEIQKAWQKAESKGFASFQQHSNGVAGKLMRKMGYVPGEGLGVRNQGVINPIEQRVRPKNLGMGYGDFKEQGPMSQPVPQPDDAEDGQEKEKDVRPRLWKKSSAAERKKRRYKIAADVVEASEELWRAPVVPTILDMRGPQARILTDFGKLSETTYDDSRPFPELQHNMDVIVEIAENEIKEPVKYLKSIEDVAAILEREQQQLKSECKDEEKSEKRLAQLKETVENAVAVFNPMAQLDALHVAFSSLESGLDKEYYMYDIPTIALDKVVPYFEKLFQNWDPFAEVDRGVEELLQWKKVLTNHDATSASLEENPLALLIIHTVFRYLRPSIVNRWNPREPEPLLAFMDVWKHILPEKLQRYTCHTLVFPKLRIAVENWNPRSDCVPLHAWMHPWLVHMDTKLQELYPAIIHKLIRNLNSWLPPDTSVLYMLQPWKTVFNQEQWDTLLTQAVLPKLAQATQDMEVNPLRHDTSLIRHVVSWIDLMPQAHVVVLLGEFFFPKWLAVLHQWLTNEPNFKEVSEWYMSWKSIFPAALVEDVTIGSFFGKALDCMNRAADHVPIPPLAAILGNASQVKLPPSPMPKPEPVRTVFTLLDIVQRYAEEHNVSFAPKHGRTQQGLQVYSFGRVSVILDNQANLVSAQFGRIWKPLSLEQLLEEMCKR